MNLPTRIEQAEPGQEWELDPLAERAELKRLSEGLSYRQMGEATGVAFSTIARVLGGTGCFNRESARKIGKWLGDDVSEIVPAEDREFAEELGRVCARAFQAEIMSIIAASLKARETSRG